MAEQEHELEDKKRVRQDDDDERQAKKPRGSADDTSAAPPLTSLAADAVVPVSRLGLKPVPPELPPSLELVKGVKTDLSSRDGFVGEAEVGIIGFVGDPEFAGVNGVIKQRFTDFLVNEISWEGEILHLVDIGLPDELDQEAANPDKAEATPSVPEASKVESKDDTSAVAAANEAESEAPQDADLPESLRFPPHADWPSSASAALRSHFSDEAIIALHKLLLEGRTPPPKQDAGWGSRQASQPSTEEELAFNASPIPEPAPTQGRQRGRGRGRGGRGGQGGRGGAGEQWRPADTREVVSQVIADKDARTAAHRVIRETFKGLWETSARDSAEGQCLSIKWSSGNQRRRTEQKPKRPRLPNYIHFTLHKTNRETQDCLGHISRMLGVNQKDLTVCGTKDKRAITVQRVCLKRNGQSLRSVWRAVNGVKSGRRTDEAAIEERGERGTRIGDIAYSSQFLELGRLKGNHFTITLRNVHGASTEEIDKAMSSIRDRGFINFFGMQRFGTSTVPTHVIGLLLLQAKWGEAIDNLLSLREGEHPDCTRARLAWLDDGDFKKALEIMPRRSVAERCIWEYWKRGNRFEDKLGAMSSIPRNLRTMYVHAYQSYLWNLVVSERVKLSRTTALVGDLVFADDHGDDDDTKETTSSREVKQLTDADVANYTIADVVMPLPGWNVEYPGGDIGKLYFDILSADGLDPHKMRRDQREYSLPGGYRKVVQKPTNVSWEHIRYTDPELPLAQSDEDRILSLNPPISDDPEGKFQALKISWSLGTASYATMALREITRQETSVWHQIGLTMTGEDRAHRGTAGNEN